MTPTPSPARSRGLVLLTMLMLLATDVLAGVVDYDIVYLRRPRFGDATNTLWPDAARPHQMDPGTDLMLLHPDGSEEVLFDAGWGSVTDPYVSFDAQWVYFSYFHDMRQSALEVPRWRMPRLGADIYRIHLQTRRVERLTHQTFSPNTGAGNWDESNHLDPPGEYNRLGYGIANVSPCPLPDGRVAFASNRNAFAAPDSFAGPTWQLFVMDEDGSNLEAIGMMTNGSALHPTVLADGRILFSSLEAQGMRDRRLWGIWAMQPDGRAWEPIVSAFRTPQAFHFATQVTGGDLVVEEYYNLSNNGFGTFYRLPTGLPRNEARFHSPNQGENPILERTYGGGWEWAPPGEYQIPFTPIGMHTITPFTDPGDRAAPVSIDGVNRVGKVTHPCAAPNGDLLLAWTDGPANDKNRPVSVPRYDSGIYLLPGATPIYYPDELICIKNSSAWNECSPRPVVPYSAIHGIDEPAALPFLPNDGTLHPELPRGTPYGIIGASSVIKRETFPGYSPDVFDTFDGLDAFNTTTLAQNSNWRWQGADAGLYEDDDIWALRVLLLEPNTHRSYGPGVGDRGGQVYFSHAQERIRVLGEIPLRKTGAGGAPVLDAEGNPDTSFLVKLPADVPFTFQTLDRAGRVLNMAQTWHQVRPGELRTDCGGCHAHSQAPLPFEDTAAAQPGFEVWDLAAETPLVRIGAQEPQLDVLATAAADVEFLRDIRPILQDHCVQCHTKDDPTPPGRLVLDDLESYRVSEYDPLLPGDYQRLANDRDALHGHPPVITSGTWRETNVSRYVRPFQSRRSLLAWKVFGERLDGWSNDDHPTESVPGDPSTLPAGVDPNHADIDFTGTIMPPPNSGVPPLTNAERQTIARWIDLGCPIDYAAGTPDEPYGWFLDDVRPTLTLTTPRRGYNAEPITEILVGFADVFSGIAPGSLSIVADVPIAGRPAGAELADLAEPAGQGVVRIDLPWPVGCVVGAHLRVEVADHQGNITRIDRRFSTLPASACQADLDGDGEVGIRDLTEVLTTWDTESPFGDVDGSGRVDIADLSEILFHWGPCCPSGPPV